MYQKFWFSKYVHFKQNIKKFGNSYKNYKTKTWILDGFKNTELKYSWSCISKLEFLT